MLRSWALMVQEMITLWKCFEPGSVYSRSERCAGCNRGKEASEEWRAVIPYRAYPLSHSSPPPVASWLFLHVLAKMVLPFVRNKLLLAKAQKALSNTLAYQSPLFRLHG